MSENKFSTGEKVLVSWLPRSPAIVVDLREDLIFDYNIKFIGDNKDVGPMPVKEGELTFSSELREKIENLDDR